jgi:hypothetical protein
MLIGAAEDAAKQADPLAAKAKMGLARFAGFDTIRLTALWEPGNQALEDYDLVTLGNAAAAARLDGIRLVVSVYPTGSRYTPLTTAGQTEFAGFAARLAAALPSVSYFIVGNEPNLNRFWMPQFGLGGTDAAAAAYEALLALTYDAIKAVNPEIAVIGGSVSPRGGDQPGSSRPTHSPTSFISDLGAAYWASGRTLPIMDGFAFHPYLENSRLAPALQHPYSTTVALADYGKLVGLLGDAFDGTAQPGSTLPILYDEFGVQSTITGPKRALYTNARKRAALDGVSEARQALAYRQAIALAYCQPNVLGLLFFHVSDERDLAAWQSGLYYADDTPKSSLASVRQAIEQAHAGTLASCLSTKRR